jgi:acyl-ACP thioesterase
MDIAAPIHAYEDIAVETFTCKSRGFSFPRGWEIRRGDRVVARATSQWALVRVADHSLVRAEEFPLSFGDEPELQTEMPLRFRIPAQTVWEKVGERHISFSDIDYNMHMNNTKYPDMLCDFLPNPAATRVTGVSLAYCKEAAYGDTLTVERASAGEGTYYIRTRKGEDVCLEALVRTENRKDGSER